MNVCKTTYFITLTLFKIVDCQWSEWTLGHCSKTCGTGELVKIRSKAVVEANNGSCTGAVSASEACNTDTCPGKACHSMQGDN